MPSFTQLEFRNILPDTDEAFVAYDADDGFRLFKEVQDGIAIYFKEITDVTPASELLQFAGNATVLGNTTVKLENVTVLNANQTVNGSTYTISKVGNSNFVALGAFDNIPGVVFTANAVVGSGTGKLVSNVIQDESIVAGRFYKILSLGTTTNWNTVAGTTGITYKAGDWIVAVAAGTGDGTVASDFSYLTSQVGQIIKVGSTWARINKFIDEQTVQVDRPVTAGAVYVPRYYPDVMLDTIIGKITAELSQANLVAGNFVVGKEYIIVSLGDTAWNTAAGTTGVTYAVGDSFKAAAVGSGTGIAAPKYVVLTQTAFNVTSALVDKYYEITTLGTTTNAQWNSIAGTTGVTYIVGNVIKIANQNLTIGTGQVKKAYPAKPITVGKTYQIVELGTTNWNTAAGTTGVTYVVGSEFSVVAVPTTGNGIVSFYNIERYYENTTEIAQGDTTIAGTYIGEPRLDSAGILKIWSGRPSLAASSNSRVVDLTASSQVFTYNSAGTSPTPASVTLTATASNTSGTVFYDFLVNDVSQQNTTTNTYVLTAPASIANRKVEVRIREVTNTSAILARDQTSVIGIQPGANGTNAVSGYLTNENHTVATDSAGAGYTLANAGGTFNIFNGTTNVTTSSTFAITGSTDNGTTLAISQNGLTFTLTKATGAYVLSGASPSWITNLEIFTVTGTFGGVTVTQVYTISKARAGANGNNGNNAISALLTNEAHTLPTTNAGVVTYTGSGTSILAYEGGTALTYAASGNSTFSVTAAVGTGTITIGTQTNNTFAQHSNMTTNNATITYTITVRSSTGATSTITKTQSLAKSTQGTNGTDGLNNATVTLFAKNTSPSTLPANFTGTFRYTFSSNALTVVSGSLNGWSTAAPSLSTGEYLWARSSTFSANTATADRTDAQFTTAVIVGGAGRNPGRVSNFVDNGLYWTTAFGGAPSTVADPTQTTYVDVVGVGRVARVTLASNDIYFQTKDLISPQIGRKYRVRVRANVVQNSTTGSLVISFFINGLNSAYTHTNPSSDWTFTADGNRVLSDASFVMADGVVNFGGIFTCTAKSADSAYWRPRFGMSGASNAIVDIYEFTIEEIVSFTTDVFQIFNNVTDVPVFDVTGSQIRMTADLNVSSGITVGAARLKVGLESIRKTGVDGAAITWADGVSIGSIPEYVLDLSNLAPLTTGESYSVLLTGVTATGATVYAKIITPGTTSTVSNSTDAAGGAGNPTRVMQKNDVADAYDNVYNFNIQCNAIQSSVFDSEVGWLTGYSVDVTPYFNNGTGWSAGSPINFSNYYTTGGNETGNPVGVGDIFPISWTNPIGNGGAGNLDFGISITGGSGNSLLLANVSYTKQTSSGLRTASPAGQTVKIAAFPRNA